MLHGGRSDHRRCAIAPRRLAQYHGHVVHLLAWHDGFNFPQPPSRWVGDVPEEIQQYNAEEEAPPGTRKPRNSAQEAAAAVARL
jgi:hypothetical protein